MFLKRFEAKGFKSFAENTVINFNHGMTGVVGPNGSGKSNIVDGLKWVLGERSKKELRGKEASDFIFSGSEAYEPANYAEVSLTFDNHQKYLKTNLTEITITRKLTRGIGKNEYFINGEPCLLKDITEIFVDTGLQQGSLGVISQGTVAWFTEAKPFERRKIFEDASGIGKYTLAKIETEKKLLSAQTNLSHAQNQFEAIEREVNRLAKQAKQAQIYLAKKEQLKKIEINVITKDVIDRQNQLTNIATKISAKTTTTTTDNNEIKKLEDQLELDRTKFHELDQSLTDDTKLWSEIQSKYQELTNNRNLLESNLKNQLSSAKIEERVQAINTLINLTKEEWNQSKVTFQTLQEEISTLEEINQGISKKIDHQKKSISLNTTSYQQKKVEYEKILEQLDHKYRYSYGLKTILENKHNLTGVYDVLENLISVDQRHELAIITALGNWLKSIIVRNKEDGANAINFLKNNRAGTATFLPIQDLRYSPFSDDLYELLINTDGFVGMANDLVSCDDLYRPAIDSILNKIIISTNLNSALKHSQLINSKYRIYTLDGDYLAPSGAMTGGYQRRKLSTINWEEKKKTYQKELEEIAETVRIQEKTCNELINTKRDNQANLEPKKQQLLTLKIKIENLDEKLKTYQNDLKQYDYSTTNPKKQQDQLTYWASELVKYEKLLQEKKGQIATTNHLKEQYRLAIQSSEQKLKEINSNYAKEAKALKELELMEARLKTLVENDINNLTQKYEITLDYAIETFNTDLEMSLEEARELIKDLNDELHKFGNVNLKAAEELKKRETEHAEKKELYDKIAKACNDLAVVIKQLDHKAISQFSQVIKKANQRLPKIFQYLFGGGSCEIVYEDPENILTSGIEIKTHLPGKTVTKLMLFSGGEKTLIALAVLLAVLQTSTIPLVILDEAESALDPANVERFGNIILKNSDKTQFIIITHRPGTMQQCEILYGVTMARNGVSIMIPIQLKEATKYIQKEQQ